MHLGLQTMAYRHFVPTKYSAEITDRYRDMLDGTLPDPAAFADLPGGASRDGRHVVTEDLLSWLIAPRTPAPAPAGRI